MTDTKISAIGQRILNPDDPADGFFIGTFAVSVDQFRELEPGERGNTHRAELPLVAGFAFSADGLNAEDAAKTLRERLVAALPKLRALVAAIEGDE